MLVVGDTDDIARSTEDYQWKHGVTAPLYNVRKRRFRKRISKRAIEDVEREVERLLQADAEAEDVRYEEVLLDQRDDMEAFDGGTPMQQEEGYGDEAAEYQDGDGDGSDLEENDGDNMDQDATEHDIVAEIEKDLDFQADTAENYSDSEEEEGDSEGDSDGHGMSENNQEGDDNRLKLLKEEILDLENKIQEKTEQLQAQINPIMKARFEGIIKNLRSELEKKRLSLASSDVDDGFDE
ncbi:hypothetical protein HDU97_001224 [Phlyctochytrium planicorne]|nr:hypothetical protein HDU97_001224 [Phlyctochytrium planicorne]